MAEADDDDGSHHFLHLPPPPPPSPSPMRRRATSDTAANGGCGEIVEVQGGHIVRSTGRKDRHSKVCTAKGPRDRRVRLSAHTAIQFYDVQDRLGFDRPSKAVDWLIKKAKTSIDELAELPPWNPADAIRLAAANAKPRRTVAKSKISPSPPPPQNLQFCGGFEGGRENPSFMPATMESDSISETMKSFFPVVAEAPSSQIMHNQDLSLSLQSFPDDAPPSLIHHHHNHSAAVAEPALFYGQSNQLGFDTSTVGWEQQSSEFGRIQRLVAWNGGETGNVGGGGGFVFASPPPPPTSYQPILGQSQQLYSHRGPLQSSYTPMIRAWFDHPNHHHHQSISTDDIHHHHNIHHIPPQVQQAAIPGMRFASGEFSSGFRVPARFQGQEEELEDGLTNKPSSVSRH